MGQAIYIVERNVKRFDLTDILDVYHFAIFLLRLRAREEEMIQVIQGGNSVLRDPEGFIKSLYEGGLPKRDHTEWAMPTPTDTTVPKPVPIVL